MKSQRQVEALLLVRTLLFGLFFHISFLASAQIQNIQVETIGRNLGLQNENILSLHQDKEGFIWIGTWYGLFRFDGYEFKPFQRTLKDGTAKNIDFVHDIFEDQKGFLWLSTIRGLLKFDPTKESFKIYLHDENDPNSLSNNFVGSSFIDSDGTFWLGPRRALEKLNIETGTFTSYPIPIKFDERVSHSNQSYDLGAIKEMGDYLYFAPTSAGLWRFNKQTSVFEPIPNEGNDPPWLIRDICFNHQKELLIIDGGIRKLDIERKVLVTIVAGKDLSERQQVVVLLPLKNGNYLAGTTGDGIIEYDSNFKQLDHFYLDGDKRDPEENNIIKLLEDHNGEIWIGTANKGLKKYAPRQNRFKVYRTREGEDNSIGDNNIRHIIETKDGKIWIATKNNGISIFEPDLERFSYLRKEIGNPIGLTSNATRKLMEDSKGRIWIGTWGFGIDVIDFKKNKLVHFQQDLDVPTSLSGDAITSICESQNNEIWIGTIHGVSVIHIDSLESGVFKNYAFTENEKNITVLRVTQILCDHTGQIWIGTELGGLQLYQPKTDSFKRFTSTPNEHDFMSKSVQSIFEDSKNRLWVGAGGLHLFLPKENHFNHKGYNDLYNNVGFQSITEDLKGNLWLFHQKLSKFNPEKITSNIYDENDGLPDKLFITSMAKPAQKSGLIYAGTRKGMVVFHPDSIHSNLFLPPIYFTSFLKYETIGSQKIAKGIKGISRREQINLSYEENTFTVGFSALSYRNSLKNTYTYLMEGLGDNWIELGTKRELTFSNLSPGKYLLKVKAANNDGLRNEVPKILEINIAPPWWKTWWAYLVYCLFLAGTAFSIYRFQLNRQLEKAETQQLKEIDALKSRLYTNITHEFRTPLTVIMGMTDNIVDNEKEKQLISRNSKNLLRLINQLLDLSKLDSGQQKLTNIQANVIPYLQYLSESFYSMAAEKNIQLKFIAEEKQLTMDFDEVKLQHIIYNLLSNAIKFTGRDNEIVFHVTKEIKNKKSVLKLCVSDKGVGIPVEKLQHIFDRFYQIDGTSTRKGEGSGVGLALTKELTELMGGSIEVESIVGQGSDFIIILPITNKASFSEVATDLPSAVLIDSKVVEGELEVTSEDQLLSNSNPILLLVEDNRDVAIYIKEILKKDYRIISAVNGSEGIEKAKEMIPDIIISDVMMPEKNGFELTHELKQDERTSHIPIILLTAKAADEDKITGLETGADAYLMKPFNKRELLIRLEKLLDLRIALQKHYASTTLLELPSEQIATEPTIEDVFIQKLRQVVMEHLDDNTFDVAKLSQSVQLSSSQLYRKLKGLMNETPNNFIQKVRLNQAMHLLKTTDLNVSEIAYSVGFSDPNYFSRAFSKFFNQAPSHFRK
ncbi:MAG: two-component regulator propeller domain-containing protein [Saprospiraceae bacterium]